MLQEETLADRVTRLELHREYQAEFQNTVLANIKSMNDRLVDVEKKIWLAAGAIAIIQVFVVPFAQSLFTR